MTKLLARMQAMKPPDARPRVMNGSLGGGRCSRIGCKGVRAPNSFLCPTCTKIMLQKIREGVMR